MHPVRSALAVVGVAALALPAAAAAKGRPDHAEKHHGGARHGVSYVFKGTWSGDALQVTGGNAHVRHAGLVGQSVTFDLADARVVVRDVNGDGSRDVQDVSDGDRVVVKARLPKGDPGDGPYAARKLVDRARSGDGGSDDSQPEQD